MKSLSRVALVLWTAASLIISPVYAQAQSTTAPQSQQQTQQQGQQQTPPNSQAPAQMPDVPQQASAAQPGPTVQISEKKLGLGRDYSMGKHWFPNIFDQYWPTQVPEPVLTNTPKIDQLIQDGKLNLSLDDAIALALEDNLDIRVQRYQPWIAETQLLIAKAGGVPQAGSSQSVVLGSAPAVVFDPELTVQTSWNQALTPVNNAFTSGAGTVVPSESFHQNDYKLSYAEGFHTGTAFSLTWDNQRDSSNFTSFVFNPWVQTTLTASISQPLLAGCCILPTTRFIIEARNGIKIADAQFQAAVIADIVTTSDDYWELVYDRQFVNVQQQAVSVSEKLYEDNKKQLQIGTMAPLQVLTAQSQLASDKQALVAAQTNELLQQTKLLNDITKNPMAPDLANVEIVPTTPIETPEPETVPIDQLMTEAWQNVPQMTVDRLALDTDNIEVKVARNALKPSLNLFAEYQATGLAGIRTNATATPLTFAADPTQPIVDATGTQSSPPLFLGFPTSFGPAVTTVVPSGVGTSEHDMINAKYPTYIAGITLGLPIRNRAAQANSARALLDERQQQVAYQQLKNTIYIQVRSSLIALEQDRASVVAATEATRLAQQTLSDEQKKYQLGASDPYTVVLRARDLTAAQGIELRDRINLVEAQVAFNQAMGRTLETNRISLADALRGKPYRTPNIPGATDADDPPPSASRAPWAPGSK
ncbi:MAG TPA: TolC family protein [Candidatus Acidoferrales bacterium]|nr:TolC family protein [Candidatus Acidoferrales bacterium]